MEKILFLATNGGLVVCRRYEDGWHMVERGLAGQPVTSVIAREGVILAGTRQGVYRSDDLGRSWQEASSDLTIRHVRWLAYHPDISDLEFAGTEPAGIFVSGDGARSWQSRPEVSQLRDAHGWYLPYSPEAGCVRGFAFHGSRAYAAVEVGGVLRSEDRGQSWQLVEGSSGDPHDEGTETKGVVHPDVHSIAVHPSSQDLVCAPTGGGFYRSDDGGQSWEYLYDCYCRAVWLDPADANRMVLGPADGVDRQGRIEATQDGGRTWSPASTGLQVPWRHHMVERFIQIGDELLAVLSNGELLAAPLEAGVLTWQPILPEIRGVAAAATMEG